jgi:glutamine amidotransferase
VLNSGSSALKTPSVVVFDYGFGNIRSAERAFSACGAEVQITSDKKTALECDGLVVPGVGAFNACMSGLRAVQGDDIINARYAAGKPVFGICVGFQILFEGGVEGVESAVTPGLGLLPGVVQKLPDQRVPHMGWDTVSAPALSADAPSQVTSDPSSVILNSFQDLNNPRTSQIPVSSSSTVLQQAAAAPDIMLPSLGERFYFVHSYGVLDLPSVSPAQYASSAQNLSSCAESAETPAPGSVPAHTSADIKYTITTPESQPFISSVQRGPLFGTQFHPEKSGEAGLQLISRWVSALG